MPAKLQHLIWRQLQHILKPLPNPLQPLAGLLLISLSILALGCLSRRPRPQPHTPEGLADVDDYTHDFVVGLVFEHLADGGQHDVEPGFVVGFAVLEGVGPAAAVFVLWVFPFGADALFEEVVVGFLGEFGGGGDVVLFISH